MCVCEAFCVCQPCTGSQPVNSQQDCGQTPGRDVLSAGQRDLVYSLMHIPIQLPMANFQAGKKITPLCPYFVHTLPSVIRSEYCTFHLRGPGDYDREGVCEMILDRLCAHYGAASWRRCCFVPWHAQAGLSLSIAQALAPVSSPSPL